MDHHHQSATNISRSVVKNTIYRYYVFSDGSGREIVQDIRGSDHRGPPRPHTLKFKSHNPRSYVTSSLTRRIAERAIWNAAKRGVTPRCHLGTRLVVQDSLVAWPDNPTGGPVRWISGWAGTGKTTIAQTLAEYWALRCRLAATFFFSRSDEETNTTKLFYETIAHQLLQFLPIPPHLPIPDLSHLQSHQRGWFYNLGCLLHFFPPQRPMIIVIDGLDECVNYHEQIELLQDILGSLHRLGPSIKILISCRPERHLENLFQEVYLGSSYRIHLGQSAEDNDDIRTFLRLSFDRICRDRRKDGAMSITERPWPSHEEVEMLVVRASGQFIFAATVIEFMDDENEDPVEMLDLLLGRRTPSFAAIDELYLVILSRVELRLGRSNKSPELRQLMLDLLLHVHYKDSSSTEIANFWFEKEVTINIVARHLHALLDCYSDEASQDLIRFRHKSFDDFLARPSSPHPFSLAQMNPVSKFFLFLRTSASKASTRSTEVRLLRGSQWLGYAFLYCEDHPIMIWPYEEEARRLHARYVLNRTTFRGCSCLPQLEGVSEMSAIRTMESCGEDACILGEDLLALCRMMEMPVDHFIR